VSRTGVRMPKPTLDDKVRAGLARVRLKSNTAVQPAADGLVTAGSHESEVSQARVLSPVADHNMIQKLDAENIAGLHQASRKLNISA